MLREARVRPEDDKTAPPDEEARPAPSPDGAPDDEREAGAADEDETGDDDLEDDDGREGDDLPPPPDDGPLRVLPIRHLPLADDGTGEARPSSAEPFRGAAPRVRTQRAWQWVPLGALLALVTTTISSFFLAALLPQTQDSLRTLADAVAGLPNDSERLTAIQAVLTGPNGGPIQQALIAIAVAFVLGLFLAGLVVGALGRAGALEAGLGAATFSLLSLLFMGGGLSLVALPSLAVAFGFGWVGGRLGVWLRARHDARRASLGM
jgi:hypothetical protein